MPKPKPKKKRGRPPKVGPLERVVGMQAASSITGIPFDAIKKAKRDGCPAFLANGSIILAELKKWMADPAKGGKPPTPKLRKIPDDSKGEFKMGIAEAWKRVLKNERDSYALYESLQKDPESSPYAIKDAEDRWNNSLDKLRMYEKSLDKNARSDDEMIPLKEVEQLIRNFMAWHKIGLSDAIRKICPNLEALKGDFANRNNIAAIIDPVIRESSALGFDYGRQAGKLPAWMVEAAILGLKEAKEL